MRASVTSAIGAVRLKYRDLNSEGFSFLRFLTVNVMQFTLKALFKVDALCSFLRGGFTFFQLLWLMRFGFGVGFRV